MDSSIKDAIQRWIESTEEEFMKSKREIEELKTENQKTKDKDKEKDEEIKKLKKEMLEKDEEIKKLKNEDKETDVSNNETHETKKKKKSPNPDNIHHIDNDSVFLNGELIFNSDDKGKKTKWTAVDLWRKVASATKNQEKIKLAKKNGKNTKTIIKILRELCRVEKIKFKFSYRLGEHGKLMTVEFN